MNLEWVTGFLEGEGGFYVRHEGRRLRFEIRLAQNEAAVLRRIAAFLNAGKVFKVNRHKPYYQLVITRSIELDQLIPLLEPRLRSICKRKQLGEWKRIRDRTIQMRGVRCIQRRDPQFPTCSYHA